MPIFVKDGRAVLFLHIPKTGGTTVERLFVKSGWAMHLRETRREGSAVFPLRRCPPQHYHASVLREILVPSRFDVVFLMTRDPISRFRSEYAMRHISDPRVDAGLVERWAEDLFVRYDADPYVLDNHVRPQVDFDLPEAERYRLEDGVATMAGDLNDRFDLGLSAVIPHVLDSVKRSGVPSSSVQVSPGLEQRLRSFYADDFTRFGYAPGRSGT